MLMMANEKTSLVDMGANLFLPPSTYLDTVEVLHSGISDSSSILQSKLLPLKNQSKNHLQPDIN